MWRHYVYLHRRMDTGVIFYVGKGVMRSRDRKPMFERAYTRNGRNVWWKNVDRKCGRSVEIFAMCKTETVALQLEVAYIAELGRGSLVNLTDGGEGTTGMIVTDKLRALRALNSRGKRSPAWVEAIRKARKNGGNGGVVKIGDKLSDSWRKNISQAVMGRHNHMFGKCGAKHPNSRRVLNGETGEIFDSVLLAAGEYGYKMKTLYNWLSGHRPNLTPLRFA